jgi:hypothetical protein
MDSKGNNSTIGTDFDFGALTLHGDLSQIDPGHIENWNLVSMDIKAMTAFLKIIKKKNSAHSITTQIHKLLERCNQTGQCTDDNKHQYQDLSNMLYSHAKQAEKESKKVGAHAWSRTLAAAGRTVQYANKEFQCLKNHKFIKL